MGMPGPFELLILAAIALVLIGIPVALIVAVVLLVKRNNRDSDSRE